MRNWGPKLTVTWGQWALVGRRTVLRNLVFFFLWLSTGCHPLSLLLLPPLCPLNQDLTRLLTSTPVVSSSHFWSPATYVSSSGNWTRATSPPILSVCASVGVRLGPWSQRRICGSKLNQEATCPWPPWLVPGWARGQVRTSETKRLPLGVSERSLFALFLLGWIQQEEGSGWLKLLTSSQSRRKWSLDMERRWVPRTRSGPLKKLPRGPAPLHPVFQWC